MEGIARPLMLAFIWMDQYRQHAEPLPDFNVIRLWADLQDVIGVDKLLVTQQPVELVLLSELVVLLA